VSQRFCRKNARRSSTAIACRTVCTAGLFFVYGSDCGSQAQPTDDTVSQSPRNRIGQGRPNVPLNSREMLQLSSATLRKTRDA
jgi:hypothetical protein